MKCFDHVVEVVRSCTHPLASKEIYKRCYERGCALWSIVIVDGTPKTEIQ